MRRVALIPARGGSKRLPRKNIIDFLGKPIIAWTIEAAKAAGAFERVVVSTEDSEIADVARKYGAEVDLRQADLASDAARIVDVCVDYLGRNPGFDLLCVLYATAPLRKAEDIRATVELVGKDCDFAVAVTHFSLPAHQALLRAANGDVRPMMPELINKRASEVGEIVVDNGSTYAVSVPTFLKEKGFFGSRLRTHVMPRERSQDIDEAIDLELAKFFAGKIK